MKPSCQLEIVVSESPRDSLQCGFKEIGFAELNLGCSGGGLGWGTGLWVLCLASERGHLDSGGWHRDEAEWAWSLLPCDPSMRGFETSRRCIILEGERGCPAPGAGLLSSKMP